MTDCNCGEEIRQLKKRVGFLENEIGDSYDKFRFKENIRGAFGSDDFTIHVDHDGVSRSATIVGVKPHHVDVGIDRLGDGFEWELGETDNGELFIEVWEI